MVLKGGNFSPERDHPFSKAGIYVLLTIMFERFSYYSLTGSLTMFFTRELQMDSVTAGQMQSLFQALVFVVPIVGGVLADSVIGRYKVALGGSLLATIGAFIMSIASYPSIKLDWLFLLGLFLPFACGAAPVKPTCIVFGADQFNETIDSHVTDRKKFFDFVYLFTNVGAGIAFLIMATMAGKGMGFVTVEYAFFATFITGAIFYTCAFGVLSLGSKNYWVRDIEKSVLAVFGSVTVEALKGKNTNGTVTICSLFGLVFGVLGSIVGFFVDSAVLQYILAAVIVISSVLLIVYGRNADWVKDACNSPKCGTKWTKLDVYGCRDVFMISPYVALCIPFWAVYNQMNTNFISQGCQMNDHDLVSPSTMNTFNALFCVLAVVVVKYGLTPALKNTWELTNNRRIAIGHIVAGISLVVAAFIEIARKKSPILNTECTADMIDVGQCTQAQLGSPVPKYSVCVSATEVEGVTVWPDVYQAEMSIFWQVFEGLWVGFAEVFVAATYYDVFYGEVAPGLRTVCQTVNMLTVSLGTLVGAVINTILASWIPNNLNDGKLELVFFVIAAMSGLAFVGHFIISKKYVPKMERPAWSISTEDEEDNSSSEEESSADASIAKPEKVNDSSSSEETSSSDE